MEGVGNQPRCVSRITPALNIVFGEGVKLRIILRGKNSMHSPLSSPLSVLQYQEGERQHKGFIVCVLL